MGVLADSAAFRGFEWTDGRPLLGRKLTGKSVRELRDLGLLVEAPDAGP